MYALTICYNDFFLGDARIANVLFLVCNILCGHIVKLGVEGEGEKELLKCQHGPERHHTRNTLSLGAIQTLTLTCKSPSLYGRQLAFS